MIEWIVTSSILIAVIISLRCLLKGKISLRLQYALWGLVLLRLLIPLSIGSSGLSVMNTVQKVPVVQDAESISNVDRIEHMTDGSVEGYYPSDFMCDFPTVVAENKSDEEYARMEKVLFFREASIKIWLCGAAVLFIAFAASNRRFSSRLRRTRKSLEVKGSALPVYISDETDTPCLFGLFRPAIYLTPETAEDATILRHTLEHETTHFRHGDNFWSVLRVVCLALHWYNPLVWWAAFLSRNDAELACDEATIHRIGESERAEYGRTLIGMTCQKRTALLITATTMTGSKSSIRKRIMLLAKKPSMAVYTLVAVVLVAAIAVGCTFTGAEQPAEQADIFSDGTITISVPDEYVDQLYVDSLYSDDLVTMIANIYYKRDYAASNEYTAQGCGGWIMSVISYPDNPMEDMSNIESGIGTEYKARATDGKRVYIEEYPMDSEYHYREHPENTQIYAKILESLQIDYGDLDSYVAPSAAAADSVALTDIFTTLTNGQTPVRLTLKTDDGSTAVGTYSGWGCGNDVQLSSSLLDYTYAAVSPEELQTAGIMISLVSAVEGDKWSVDFYDGSNFIQLITDNTATCYQATPVYEGSYPVGTILRMWYDEAEFQGIGGTYEVQGQIVIPDEGQDYLTAAKEYCEAFEEKHLIATTGSKFCYTYVSCQTEAADDATTLFRENGEIDANTYAFFLTTVFVPENERARDWSMAGNTGEYTGSDPDVPEGAYEYYRCGYITLDDDGWHGNLVGTGW